LGRKFNLDLEPDTHIQTILDPAGSRSTTLMTLGIFFLPIPTLTYGPDRMPHDVQEHLALGPVQDFHQVAHRLLPDIERVLAG
jgi:hypothetical protein